MEIPNDCLNCGVCCFSKSATYVRVNGEDWTRLGEEADQYARFVGQRAMVTQLSGLDTSGCPGVRVNVDGGEFFWRIRDMRM